MAKSSFVAEVTFKELTDFSFKGVNREFISVDGHVAKWTKQRRLQVEFFTYSLFKKALKYLIKLGAGIRKSYWNTNVFRLCTSFLPIYFYTIVKIDGLFFN